MGHIYYIAILRLFDFLIFPFNFPKVCFYLRKKLRLQIEVKIF